MKSNVLILIFVNKKQIIQKLYNEFDNLAYKDIVQIENRGNQGYKISRRKWFVSSSQDIIKRFQTVVLNSETLLIVECQQQECAKFIQIIQNIQEEPLAFYVLSEEEPIEQMRSKELLPQTPVTHKELEKQAEGLAKKRAQPSYKINYSRVFIQRVQFISEKYQSIFDELNDFALYIENIHLSAEWLLENAYNVKQTIKDVQTNLPQNFAQELPFITEGPDQGIPTIYPLVCRLVAATDGRVTRENITTFLNAYQQVSPLTIGELWAFPLMIKIRLIECLVHLTKTILDRVRQNQLAGFWGNRILNAIRLHPDQLYTVLAAISKEIPSPSAYFAEQILIQLGESDSLNAAVKGWLQRKLGEHLPEIFQYEQSQQTLEQTSLANTITSLHTLARLNWREVFEEVCTVDKILAEEALSIYQHLNFDTRDKYRHEVEKLSKELKRTECDVARQAVALTKEQSSPLLSHVGYYLIDTGRDLLEKTLNYQPSLRQKIYHYFSYHCTAGYFAICFSVVAALMAFFLWILLSHDSMTWISWLLLALSAIPIWEGAIQIVNFIFAHCLPPQILPKMDYEKGIPAHCRTLVVIPTLLISEDTIAQDVERLEIHYLANADENVIFGIISDFKDAPTPSLPEDEALLKSAREKIKLLNNKYDTDQFYLFHRARLENTTEGCWMGWERKRGKLEQLNAYLSGVTSPELDEFLVVGEPFALTTIRYVLTADSDTQLPKDSVKTLVETLSHPLNVAYLDKDERTVTRGYTIIQPRVSTNFLSANATWFSKLCSDPSGVDPYSKSVSDIYQDIFEEGIYHGKGLYDFQVFHRVLSNRFPENLILSHDLLEGSYVRTGFASDIELNDSFPQTYEQYCKRQHRWVRGDWQLLRWLSPKVCNAQQNKEQNPLTLVNRWKIVDNLKRSLLPIVFLAILFVSWLGKASFAWTALAVSLIILPMLLQIVDGLWSLLKTRLVTVWNDLNKSMLRALMTIATLPHMAWVNGDAIFRALYRQFISRKSLLNWDVSSQTTSTVSFYSEKLLIVAALALGLGVTLAISYPWALLYAGPFLTAWIAAPFIVRFLDRPYKGYQAERLSNQSQRYLRRLARETWRFFDDFVSTETHWLPPDNYQEKLRVEVAYRTSPTNIGFYMMSILSAQRLEYITIDQLAERLQNISHTLKGMQRVEGHFLNWYDIKTLEPLSPRYVSTVDSGNLLASFWSAEQKCRLILEGSVVQPIDFCEGVHDTYFLLKQSLEPDHWVNASIASLNDWNHQLFDATPAPQRFVHTLDAYTAHVAAFIQHMPQDQTLPAEAVYWWRKLHEQLMHMQQWIEQCIPWIKLLDSPTAKQVVALHPEGNHWRSAAFEKYPSLLDLHERNIPGLMSILGWLQTLSLPSLDGETQTWVQQFIEKVISSFTHIEELHARFNHLAEEMQSLSSEMNMIFLYNTERKLFTIGYNVSERRLDNSYYDLLASEARLASFIAIARGDVPVDHWWALGRPLGHDSGQTVLLSWGGTMFEYLMPVIWCRNYDNTLLDFACKAAVNCQIAYAQQRGIPWGISESAYSRLDLHDIYQYRAFGVPYLGLKRGLEKDLVITPYSSAMALMVDPIAAAKNLKRLDMQENMNGIYGLYEAIDFSRGFKPGGRFGIVIHAYMAHHMGMSLSSYCNVLFDGYLQDLFHSHPRVKAVETILYERPFIADERVPGREKERAYPKLTSTLSQSVVSSFDTPNTPNPISHLLSNGSYSVMITNSGGGYSRYQELDITRWRSDATCDNWGSFFYVHDLERNVIFNNAYHPLRTPSNLYHVNFSNHKAEITKRSFGIEVVTEIVVSPEDNVEIRSLTLANLSMRHRSIEITSYVELALAPHMADISHPAFSKMFVETEALADKGGLLAHRRLRSPEDKSHWCFHVAAVPKTDEKVPFRFETSREAFIGRGRTLSNPLGIEMGLKNSKGGVLDPIFSLNARVELPPGKRAKISFVTGYAGTRDEVIKLLEKYKELEASQRVIDMSWTYAELALRRLHITQEDAKLYQRLASAMIFPDNQLRAAPDRIRRNTLGQDKLWGFGISGDNPILLVTIADVYDLDIIHSVLQAHAFWSLRGLKSDIVIINEERTAYEMPLDDHLLKIAQNYAQYTGLNKSGGIYLLGLDKIHREEQNLLYTVAHIVIIAGRGSLAQQLLMPRPGIALQPYLKVNATIPEEPSPPLPFLELLFFNGIGGFNKEGNEYAIYLGNNPDHTPAPWINIIANKQFGFLASESGLGMSWSGNSQMNRLTPWCNDPTVNPITDICYLRDDDSGTFWTITPSPIKENDPYRARHGHGYTVYEHNSHAIEQEMTVFTPLDEHHTPIRIQILRLTNRSSRQRRISVYGYCDLTMGTDRETSQRYIVTNWNYESKALTAVNHYRNVFAERVVFFSSSPPPASYTASRKEFIGRNGGLDAPAALKHVQLSGLTDPAQDPCFALQTNVDLFKGETVEVIFVFGEASHMIKVKDILKRYLNHDTAWTAFAHTKKWWDQFLSQIHVNSPHASMDAIFNKWLTYQNLSCRMWTRSAFYQSGGAFGFRDQLQDSASLVYFDPQMTREHIIKCAGRQFIEGDVQHWWHPESGSGVRTRISDDLLWLPYVALHYMRVTQDEAIMNETIAYLEGRLLEPDEHEAIVIPKVSNVQGTLKEHCIKAIDKALHFGPHGLPLIGGGDWNDGMNLVGVKGEGESVWLAWFLIHILQQFITWLRDKQDLTLADKYAQIAKQLEEAVENNAWDGDWYIRAFFDDQTPIGSNKNEEDKIDSLPQSWAVMSGGREERRAKAMHSVEEHLIDETNELVLLFTPPYDKSPQNPGYIKGYPPGVRENGGQYTHAAVWVAMALAKQGEPEKALRVIDMINPIDKAGSLEDLQRYRVEPYVTAADVYALKGQVGRGGWTWYTGSTGVLYRVILEDILGFQLQGDKLRIAPVIPPQWTGFHLTYHYGEAVYEIHVENPAHVKQGVAKVFVDSVEQPDKIILLSKAPGTHTVFVHLG